MKGRSTDLVDDEPEGKTIDVNLEDVWANDVVLYYKDTMMHGRWRGTGGDLLCRSL